jgi:hypothetical protein
MGQNEAAEREVGIATGHPRTVKPHEPSRAISATDRFWRKAAGRRNVCSFTSRSSYPADSPRTLHFSQGCPYRATDARQVASDAALIRSEAELRSLIIAEGFDCAIRVGYLQDSNLIAKRIGPIYGKLVASSDYIKTRGSQTPDELVTHQALMQGTEAWQFMDRERSSRFSRSAGSRPTTLRHLPPPSGWCQWPCQHRKFDSSAKFSRRGASLRQVHCRVQYAEEVP